MLQYLVNFRVDFVNFKQKTEHDTVVFSLVSIDNE